MLRLLWQPYALGGAVEIPGDDIPADATAGQMIERRKPARQNVWIFVGDRAGNPEAEVAGDVGHRRDQQQRIIDRHLDGLRYRRVRRPAVDIVDTEHIGQKERVELAALEELRQLDPVSEHIIAVCSVARMRPQARRLMPDAIHVESIQADLPWHRLSLAPAGGGTYTVGDYRRSNRIGTPWMRMNCAGCRRR